MGPVGKRTHNHSRPLALINAHVVDPSQDLDSVGTLLISGGAVEGFAEQNAAISDDFEVVDLQGKYILPGLVDMQARTGEPGDEHEETLETAGFAAAHGGVTTMVLMPDTNPVIDDIALLEFMLRTGQATGLVNVEVMGALTMGLQGKELGELRLMQEAGAVGFTNGRTSLANAQILRRALTYCKDFDGLIVHATQDADLAGNGVMNEGEFATRAGLPGIPKASEYIMLERDMRLTELTGGRYHAASISCAESVEIIRRAKDKGLRVTCGTSINNVALNENDIGAYRTFLKLSPPVRSEEDRQAILQAVEDGTIDVIHSDHCPKDVDKKRHPFADAADGAIGLETLLAAGLRISNAGELSLNAFLKAASQNPAQVMNLQAGSLATGMQADFSIVDIDEPWKLAEEDIVSRSKNTPFEGHLFTGKVKATYVSGVKVYEE